MAFSPGRSVGRVSIRVVPDTTKFRRELKRDLDRIAAQTRFTVRVDKAKVDSAKLRRDIERQLGNLENVTVRVKAAVDDVQLQRVEKTLKDAGKIKIEPTMDRLTVERTRRAMERNLKEIEVTLGASINDRRLRQQLDHMAAAFDRVSHRLADDIMSPADAERLRHRLNQISDHIDRVARDRTTRMDVNPFTAWASSRLAWLTRPRTVEVFVRLNKRALLAVTTTLAALSGARLSWKWIDDLIRKMKDLDKNLPRLLGWTTGITSLVAALFAATSGLVGVGQGLFSILPAFLVIPGLLLNAIGSFTALFVALKHSKEELSELSDDMNELGGIIRETFWARARQPILDLVNGLMPQLRNAFRDLSEGVGDFTAAMSRAFGEELADGRLESIFKGIADGWRVLGTGAKGFAGALVSLSQIAATYTPRLAAWFVRQANTFDAWLKAIAEDGRLGRWMEDAIDSMYDLWDATRGIAGVFAGIWKSAESAGSGGLKGFAELMLTWRRVVNSADFQKGLTAIFRGSYVAMDAFGDAIRALGRLVADLDGQFERFVGATGTFLGGLFEAAFESLNNVNVAVGLDEFSSGLLNALDRIKPSLDPIASTFGNFLGLLGRLAENVLPTAAAVLADLMPAINGIIDAIEPILPTLADAVLDISEALAPAVADLVKALGPLFVQVATELATALVDFIDGITPLINVLVDFADALGAWADGNKGFFDGIAEWLAPGSQWKRDLQDVTKNTHQRNPETGYVLNFDAKWDDSKRRQTAEAWANSLIADYNKVVERRGPEAGEAFMRALGQVELPDEIRAALEAQFDISEGAAEKGRAGVAGLLDGVRQGIESGLPDVENAASGVKSRVTAGVSDAGTWLAGAGGQTVTGYTSALTARANALAGQAVEGVKSRVASSASSAGSWLTPAGSLTAQGYAAGIGSSYPAVSSAAAGLKSSANVGAGGGYGTMYGIGENLGAGIRDGLNSMSLPVQRAASRLVNMAAKAAKVTAVIESPSKLWRKEIGQQLGAGVVLGLQDSRKPIERAASALMDAPALTGAGGDAGRGSTVSSREVNLNIHNPVVRDLMQEARAAAEMAKVML